MYPLPLFLPIFVYGSVAPVWKTPITERRYAPQLKRSSAPYYTRPEDFKIPNYIPPQNRAPPPRLPVFQQGVRPNYQLYQRPQYPPYPQSYRVPPRNGWIYWNGVIIPPEAVPYLTGVGPIPPQGVYGPRPTLHPPVSPGFRPETFTGTLPQSPSVSPTIAAYPTSPPPTLPSTILTIQEEDFTTPTVTVEEATMGNLFTAKKNSYTTSSESTYGLPETTEIGIEASTTTTDAPAEYFPRPVPAQSYQPSKGPEIVEKLNVNILHPNGFDKSKVSVYTPPKGPKLLISNAAKGQVNFPRPSVPEQKYLPYAPNLKTSARPIEQSNGGPRVFLPPNAFSFPPYDEPTPPSSPQISYSPTAKTISPPNEYQATPPSAPSPSPPSYTPEEEEPTPTVPDYNRGPASTFPPEIEVPPATTTRLPPWATSTPSEETYSPTYRPVVPSVTPESPTPRTPELPITRPLPSRTPEGPRGPSPSTAFPPEVRIPENSTPPGPEFNSQPPQTIRIPENPIPRFPSRPPEDFETSSPPSRITSTEQSTTPEVEKPPISSPGFPSKPPEGSRITTPSHSEIPSRPSEERLTPPPSFGITPPTTDNFNRPSPEIPRTIETPRPPSRPSSESFTSPTLIGPSQHTTPYYTVTTSTTLAPYPPTKKGIQNRLRAGKVRVVCQENGIKFIATSILPFTGEIFGNDRKRIPACFHTFQNVVMPMAFLPFNECGVKNAALDQEKNQTQYHMQVVVVTKQTDGSTTVQSYMAQCVHQKIKYNKQTLPRRIEEALEELRLVPIKLEQKALLPLVEMKVLVDEHGRIGPEVAAVDIGMPLALHWKLTNESAGYGFHVKNCAVADMISGVDMIIIDEQGCSTDTTILAHPHYDTYHDAAASHMWAFKVPDHSKLRFSCEVAICTDIPPTNGTETSCSSVPTPPFCPDLITSPSNSILFDGGGAFLKRRREIDEMGETQTVRATICTSNDCSRDYVSLPHCVDPHWLAGSTAFTFSLFVLSVVVNIGLRCKVATI